MDRPLEIRDVENISLEASDDNSDTLYPLLVAQFACFNIQNIIDIFDVRCSAVWMINVTHATIEGISVTVKSPNVSAVVLQQCSHVHISSISSTNNTNNMSYSNELQNSQTYRYSYDIGILAYGSSDISVSQIQARRFNRGIVLYNTSNTDITDTTVMNSRLSGLVLEITFTTHITNLRTLQNEHNGIETNHCTNTSMKNISAAHNKNFGFFLETCTHTIMKNIFAAQNQTLGIVLENCADTTMSNISAAHHWTIGMVLVSCNHDGYICSTQSRHRNRFVLLY